MDTSIVIEAFKNNQNVLIRLNSFETVFISGIAVGEFYYGAYYSGNILKHLRQIEDFLSIVAFYFLIAKPLLYRDR